MTDLKIENNKIIKMSIYSGFATRSLQQTYDQCVCDILFVLQKRIIKFYQNIEADQDKFFNIFSNLYHQIVHMQKSKYLEPKSSIFINQIYDYLKQKKHQRSQCPEQDLKKFEKSLALKSKQQQILQNNQIKINNLVQRSALSFGKIKKQLQNHKFVVNYSHSIGKDKQSANQSFQKISENPEQKNSKSKPKRLFSSNGLRNSLHKQQIQNQSSNQVKINILSKQNNLAEEVVKEYLEKTNKNYLRGYRKRRIREEFSSVNQIPKFWQKQKKIVH